MEDKIQKNVQLLNKLKDEKNALDLLYVNLISSDSLVDVKSCKLSIDILTGLVAALPFSDVDNKKKWRKLFLDGIAITERDLKEFQKTLTT